MAKRVDMCAAVVVVFLGFLCATGISTRSSKSEELQYCSFFNNRAPRSQPSLKNCTWFKGNSCCMQQEIAATFGRVKPLKGASLACQKYVNYLMCYICAPNQNIFYKQERLTVCESFCDALYDSCNSAILKGSVIRNLYSSGMQFCQSRRFEVATTGCFTFDVTLDTSGANPQVPSCQCIFVLVTLCVCLLLRCPVGLLEPLQAPDRRHKSRGNRTVSYKGPAADTSTISRTKQRHQHPRDGRSMPTPAAAHHKIISTWICESDGNRPVVPKPDVSHAKSKQALYNNHCQQHHHHISTTTPSTAEMLMRQVNKLWPKLDSALAITLVLLFVVHLPKGARALTDHEVETWADMLAAELSDTARRGLKYEQVQQLYDRALYGTEYVNGTAKVQDVRQKLATYFVSKKRRALELAEWVRIIHDEWWAQSTQLKAQAGAWGHRWRRGTVKEPSEEKRGNNYDGGLGNIYWPEPQVLDIEELMLSDDDQTVAVDQEGLADVADLLPDFHQLYGDASQLFKASYSKQNNNEVLKDDKSNPTTLPQDSHHRWQRSVNTGADKSSHNIRHSTEQARHDSTVKYRQRDVEYTSSNDGAEMEYGPGGYGRRRRSDSLLPNHGVDPVVTDSKLPLAAYVHVNDLDINVYKDADIRKRLPKNLFKYDRDFRQKVMPEHSTVKIPDDVPRDSQEVFDTISWTAKLDKVFRENGHKDSTLRWQYFGSASGVHRVFPGHEWPANFIGFHEDYDPRTRPWYVAATSGPKNIVLVVDSSASMSEDGSMNRMKSVARNILSTLSKKDSVNIVVSRSEFWSRNGIYYPHRAEVVSCHKTALVPASTANLKELHTAVQDLQPYGGSYHIEAFQKAFNLLKNASRDDCHSFVIFVTDGQSSDLDQRCSPGYYKYDEQNRKHYQAGEPCVYDFDEVTHIVSLLQYQLHKRTHLFTFLTSDKGHNRVLPGQLACDNQGAMAKVTEDSNTFHQMAPYFRFLEASSGARSAVWTAPYVDRAGLGLMVTVSVPVYSNLTRSHLGVVGIDVELNHIENIMRNELWGSTYAFVIDSEDGSAIIHPFSKPSAQLLEDPAFIPITHLETHDGEPHDFSFVLEAMMARETGSRRVVKNAQRAISVHNSLVWRPTEYNHYFYTDIPGSDFSFAFNLAQTDQTFQHARDPPIDGPLSFLHEMNLYKKLQEEIPGAWAELRPSDKIIKYPGIEVTFAHSVVKLAPRGFCNAAAYMEEQRPSFIDIHEYINIFTPTYDVHCPRGTYRTDVRPDVKLTAQLEALWKQRDPTLQQQIAWTYIGTMGGVMRIFPGVEISRDFDPTTRPWYHRSEVNRGRLVVSSVYQDSVPGMGKVVTLSRAIHKAKPLTPPDCTGERRGYGCPCDSNHQCKSEYCYFKSCADDLIQGVVALDLRYPDFHTMVTNVLRSTGTRKYCNLRYNCNKARPCEVRCYLVDDVGNLVYDAAFIHVPDSDVTKYEAQSLASREGQLFSQLVRKGIYIQQTRLNFEGVCKVSNNIPQGAKSDRHWMPEPTDNPDDPTMARGPIPPFQNEYSCMQQMVYYETNKTLLRNITHVSGVLDDSPCSAGKYHFMPIDETNLFLLVLDDYMDLSSPVNFNCHITNRVLAPGAYHVQPNSCHGNHMTTPMLPLRPPRVCHRTKMVPLYCGYSTAAWPALPVGRAYVLLVNVIIVACLVTSDRRH